MRYQFRILILVLLPLAALWAQREQFEEISETYRIKHGKPLEIRLDVDAAEVLVEKGTEAWSASLHLKFTEGEFREDLDFDEGRNRLTITLEKRHWHRVNRNGRDEGEDVWALLELRLPTDAEILFDSKIKAGEVTMLVGGLRLREFFFTNWAGEVEIRFDEPNQIPMEILDIDAKVGEVRLVSAGNARFERATINGGIGQLNVDFTGAILDESEARVDLEIGEATVILPDNAGIQMKITGGLSFLSHKRIDRSMVRRGNSYYSDDFEDSKKRFYLRVSPGLGELNIDRD